MPVIVAVPLVVSLEQREVLESMARSSSLPHRTVVQARALLFAADGVATNEVARRCQTTPDSVLSWRRRFEATCCRQDDPISAPALVSSFRGMNHR